MERQQQHQTFGSPRMMQPQQPQQSSPQRLPNSPQLNSSSSPKRTGPRANCDQVVFEAVAKAAEIVVASRCWIGDENNNGTSSASTSNGRFNLLVPEIKSVRNILKKWKRTMHVPLRLDVYYQHPPKEDDNETNGNNSTPGDRELLERWCLEYAPPTSANAAMMEGEFNRAHSFDVDPIVYLRKVCKNIVVWLRTLYCHSRLLPAQALKKTYGASGETFGIGFSIYVVGDGQDDVSGLVQQGFDSQPKYQHGQPTGVMTPYGVLGWRVYLAPKELVKRLVGLEKERARLLPLNQHQYSNTVLPKATLPIPQDHFGYSKTPPAMSPPPVARSAPSSRAGMYKRANSTPMPPHHHLQEQQQQAPSNLQQQQSPERYYSKSPSTVEQPIQQPRSYHHRRTFTEGMVPNIARGLYPEGDSNKNTAATTSDAATTTLTDSPSDGTGIHKKPSALSLALMSMKEDNSGTNADDLSGTNPPHAAMNPNQLEQALPSSEKRHAALHNAPPVVAAAPTGIGEYGYAYNNNSQTPPTSQQQQMLQMQHQRRLSSSPSSFSMRSPSTPTGSTFGTTPPGYLLGATPSVGSYGTSFDRKAGLLLPPARSPTNVLSPPFVRPPGFISTSFIAQQSSMGTPQHAAASPTTEGLHARPSPEGIAMLQQQQQPQTSNAAATAAAAAAQSPTTSTPPPQLPTASPPAFDMLHPSPFHHSSVGVSEENDGGNSQNDATEKDGLASYYQKGDKESMEAATNFINDFYHHHYPMASMSSYGYGAPTVGGGEDYHIHPDPHHHHHLEEHYGHHHHSHMYETSAASTTFGNHDMDSSNDMPFAVDEGMASTSPNTPQGGAVASLIDVSKNAEASLLAASMAMVPHKKLAMFSSQPSSVTAEANVADGADATKQHRLAEATNNSPFDMDALVEQLNDFRSFGATLQESSASSTPLTTSVGSGG